MYVFLSCLFLCLNCPLPVLIIGNYDEIDIGIFPTKRSYTWQLIISREYNNTNQAQNILGDLMTLHATVC